MADNERRPIAQLNHAEQVNQVFLISQPQLRSTTRGDYYIAAFLSDSTGKLNGRMWQASEAIFKSLPQEGFVRIKGRVENYQGALQIVFDAIRPVDIDEVNLADFLPQTEKNPDQMFDRLKTILADIQNPHLARLAQVFLDDQELMKQFKQAPAAIALHHAYLGGLLEHTLSMLDLACRILPHYLELNADLVLTAIFLHDIGKTTELDYDISFKYSDQGRLLGHIVKGALLIEEKIRQLDQSSTEKFPKKLKDCLIHIVISHHGIREYGCPVLPAMPEAFAVHYIDNLDSKIALTLAEINKDPGNTDWTNYVRAIEAPVYKCREFN
ncbi:MAG: HD domain-containing protein [Sedimentisphaerales bacterium]|nr:HD domain-containing protein [Sedimentisphaerales bacterium]